MTVLVLGLDALDSKFVKDNGLFESLDYNNLHQDLSGANALYTYRVWPSIFTGTLGGKSEEPYDGWDPDEPYIWERWPARVNLAPVDKGESVSVNSERFPEKYIESRLPEDRMSEALERLEADVTEAVREDEYPLVIGCTRIPDMVSHLPRGNPQKSRRWIEQVCNMAERLVNQPEVDEYVVVSDHGFKEIGMDGINAHSRRATLASSCCDYETMSGFIEGWIDDIAPAVKQQQLEALGYR